MLVGVGRLTTAKSTYQKNRYSINIASNKSVSTSTSTCEFTTYHVTMPWSFVVAKICQHSSVESTVRKGFTPHIHAIPATFFPASDGNGDSVSLRQPRIDPRRRLRRLVHPIQSSRMMAIQNFYGFSNLLESHTVFEASYNYV